MTIFDLALRNDSNSIIEYLIGGDVNCIDDKRQSLLHYATRGMAIETTKLLLEKGALVNAQDCHGETPIYAAINASCIVLIKTLIAYGASINIDNKYMMTPLDLALKKGNEGVINLLIDNGALLSEMAAFYAVRSNQLPILKIVLKRNPCLLSSLDEYGNSLIHWAVIMDNIEIVKYLCVKGLSIHLKNKNHETAMFSAVRKSSIAMMHYLVSMGMSISLKNSFGQSLLTVAEEAGSSQGVIFLTELDYDIRFQQQRKKIRLHDCVKDENFDEVTRLLLTHSVNQRDQFGKRPLDYAIEVKNYPITKLLKSYMK